MIQQRAAARARFSVDEADAAFTEVIDLAYLLRIARRGHQPLFPPRKRHDAHVFPWKLLADIGHVEFAGLRVLEMGSRDVHLARLEPRERQLTRRWSADNFDAADLFDHVREEAGRRIAPREHQPLLCGFLL